MIDFGDAPRRKPSVNLSALIDVAFILVIFVVLSATFQRQREIEIQLPGTSEAPPRETEGLEVDVFADGRVAIDGQVLEGPAIRAALERERETHEAVVLVADASADLQVAIDVLEDARAAGFEAVAVATRGEDGR